MTSREGAQPATRYASPVAAVTAILRHAKAKRLGLDTMLGRELCPEPNWSAEAAAITAGASTLPLDEVSFWRRDLKALIGDDPAFQRVVAEAVLWFGSMREDRAVLFAVLEAPRQRLGDGARAISGAPRSSRASPRGGHDQHGSRRAGRHGVAAGEILDHSAQSPAC